jgi:putative flippase GtrA
VPDAGTFAAVAVGLLVAHQVADHWVQTGHQAATKGRRDNAGRLACARHVASYTTLTALAVVALWGAFQLDITWLGFAAGQLVSAVTHYWADRRFTLAWLAALTGKTQFYVLGAPRAGRDDNPSLGTGAYALDQSWHWGWLGVAAFLTAVL